MKISCSKETLNHAVQIVQKAISSKTQMPILSGIYLHANNTTLELQATDYELGISCTIDAVVEEPGIIVLSGRYFQEMVRKMPGATIEIATSKQENTIKITSNNAQFNLLSLPAEEFPVLKKTKSDTTFTIKDNVLKELIKKTVFACATDDSRPIFTGGLLEIKDGYASMVATNTHRLALKRDNVEHSEGTAAMIVPSKMLSELARIINTDIPEDIVIYWLKNQIALEFDNIYIISRLIEGKFPDYNKVIPPSFATYVKTNTDSFLEAVERVSLLAKDGDYNVIKMSFTQDSIIITSNNPDVGKAYETVLAETDGNGLDIAFNAKYITDVLKNITSEQIVFALNTPLSPSCIKPTDDENYTYIVTPVRTN